MNDYRERRFELEKSCREDAMDILLDPEICPQGCNAPESAALMESDMAEMMLENTVSAIAGALRVTRLNYDASPLLWDCIKGFCADVLILGDIIDAAAPSLPTGPAEAAARAPDPETALLAVRKAVDTMDETDDDVRMLEFFLNGECDRQRGQSL